MATLSATRSIVIAAPAHPVFGLLADPGQWPHWSPWADAAAPEITEATPDTAVRADVRGTFALRFRASLDIETFESDLIRVTWTVTGEVGGVAGPLTRMLPLARLVGRDLDRGLATLKLRAEEA